jgi:rhomboid protease GluP
VQDEPEEDSSGSGPLEWLHAAAQTPFTSLAVCACVGVWIALQFAPKPESPADYLRWGVASFEQVQGGAWWALFTAGWTHLALWHLAFNVYWFWRLGKRIEEDLGPLRLALLCVVAQGFASFVELGVSETTGLGASGMGYALFGYAWIARRRSVELARVMPPSTVRLFLIWLVLCMLATELRVLNVANGGHTGGLIVGVCAGWLATERWGRALGLATAAAALAVVPWFGWRPWSPQWQYETGWEAQVSGDFETAERHYRTLISVGGDELWARAQLALLLHVSGRDDEANKELERVKALDEQRASDVRAALEFADECRAWAAKNAPLVNADLREGVLAAAQGKLRVARTLYGKCLEASPKDDAAWTGLVRAAYNDPRCLGAELEEVLVRLERVPTGLEAGPDGPLELLAKLRARLEGHAGQD